MPQVKYEVVVCYNYYPPNSSVPTNHRHYLYFSKHTGYALLDTYNRKNYLGQHLFEGPISDIEDKARIALQEESTWLTTGARLELISVDCIEV